MANTAQAKKRTRQIEKHRQHNATLRSKYRTSIKKALVASQATDKQATEKALREAVSAIDRAGKKGIIHRNAAARYKSKLSRRVREAAATTTA